MRTVYRADLLFKLHSPLGRRLGHNDERWDVVITSLLLVCSDSYTGTGMGHRQRGLYSTVT